jgi:RsiW-degrading membrane proteinase PrsW (M82 family)
VAEQWFYIVEGAQKGPVDLPRLAQMAAEQSLSRASLVWTAGMAEWKPLGDVHAAYFPQEQWYYMASGTQQGPVEADALAQLVRSGAIHAGTMVWKEGMPQWRPAGQVPGILPEPPPMPEHAPAPAVVAPPAAPGRSMLGGLGARISEAAELPTISNVPIRDILMGGFGEATRFQAVDTEDDFAVGTKQTTPKLQDVPTGWPRAKVFWRMLIGSIATYMVLRYGLTAFGNMNFFPGMVVVGSFVVPFSVVVLLFEMNVPRNVSAYQVGKMLFLGGAASLIVTMFVFNFVPGAGTGNPIAALLTGFGEELGKALALLIVAWPADGRRWRWQLNGLLFGAAVGAGFAGFESAGYAFRFALKGGIQQAIDIIFLRGILAPGGHVIWTAMVGSAIWKVKGDQPFSIGMLFHGIVIRRFCIAVILHGLWDSSLPLPDFVQYGGLVLVGWYLIFAMLKQAIDEVAQAKALGVPA